MRAASPACDKGDCQCAAGAEGQPQSTVAAINGISLHEPGQRPGDDALRELAWGELLRQEAVRRGLLPPHAVPRAPALGEEDQRVIEAMLDDEVGDLQPSEDE